MGMMLGFRRAIRCGLVLLIILIAPPVYARTISGTVTDHNGRPVPGAAVRCKNSETLRIRSARTTADGTYRFSGLSPRADYEFGVAQGALEWLGRLSRFDEGAKRIVNLQFN